MGYDSHRGQENFSLADGCFEETLLRLRKDSAYAGGTLNFGAASCIITVTGGGATRTIVVTASEQNYNSIIDGGITITGSDITVDSWQEREN
jgi:hypothetical protein